MLARRPDLIPVDDELWIGATRFNAVRGCTKLTHGMMLSG